MAAAELEDIMRTIIKTRDLSMALINALGLSDKADRISKIEIDMPVGGLITSNVSFLPDRIRQLRRDA